MAEKSYVTVDVAVAPPHPPIPAEELPFFAFLRAIRTNALTMWTEAAYQEDVLVRNVLGRSNMMLNAPDAIRRVLVDNPTNYRRSPASVRILRPMTGMGLLLSEGDDWRHQRRTIAPALAPRNMPMLARPIVACVQEALATLAVQAGDRVDLLAAMQNLALEIAGRSMFSMEMLQYGPAMRRQLTEYGRRYAHPHLLDMVLPASIPTLRDLGRRRFQRAWMGLIEEIMRARQAEPPAETPRDLFDLLLAARDPESGEGFSPTQLRDQIATMILAGHETTAVTLFWALVLLCGAPAEQRRVAEEARRVEIRPDTAMDALAGLVHTRAVVSETLRLYPPAFTIVRQAIGRRSGRCGQHPAWVSADDRALGAGPASSALARSRCIRSVPLPARCAAHSALRLSAVRRRPARLRRRTVRTHRGDVGAGHVGPGVRGVVGRGPADAGRSRDDAA